MVEVKDEHGMLELQNPVSRSDSRKKSEALSKDK